MATASALIMERKGRCTRLPRMSLFMGKRCFDSSADAGPARGQGLETKCSRPEKSAPMTGATRLQKKIASISEMPPK